MPLWLFWFSYTLCLEELPKIKVTDALRLVKASSESPTSLLDNYVTMYRAY